MRNKFLILIPTYNEINNVEEILSQINSLDVSVDILFIDDNSPDLTGKLLDEMLRAVGLDRSTAFITNILKCRPPNNRDPARDETVACRSYLEGQIELVKPRLILAVGRIAAQALLNSDFPVGRLRGRPHFLNDRQVPLVVTYHPAYLLRSPSQKRKVWEDLCLARKVVQESLI